MLSLLVIGSISLLFGVVYITITEIEHRIINLKKRLGNSDASSK